MLRERSMGVSRPTVITARECRWLRDDVAVSIRRAQARIDRSRELCRVSEELLRQSVAGTTSEHSAGSAVAPTASKRAPWLGN